MVSLSSFVASQTFVKEGGKHIAISPATRVAVKNDCTLTFGALKCRIMLGSAKNEVRDDISAATIPVNIS